jgi:peptidyl-prolyl cis-trans isomerase SurA
MLLKEYRDGILLFSLMNQEVWQRGISDSLGQVGFYEANLAKYQWKDRIEAYLVRVIDLAKLPDARRIFQSSGFNPSVFQSFESAYKANSPLAYTTEKGIFEYQDHPIISKLNLDLTYQEISLEGSTYLVVLGNKIPAGSRKFEESRGLVIRDYQEFLEKSLNEKLKAKFPVEVNQSVKEQTFVILNKPNPN